MHVRKYFRKMQTLVQISRSRMADVEYIDAQMYA